MAISAAQRALMAQSPQAFGGALSANAFAPQPPGQPILPVLPPNAGGQANIAGQGQPQAFGGQPQLAPNVQGGPIAPQTGLIGREQALQGGLAASLAGLTEGIGQGQQGIQQGLAQSLGLLNQGQGQAQQAIQGGLNQGLGLLNQAQGQGLGAINQAIGQGVGGLNQFTGAGVQGQQQQAALAGLGGQGAFDQAFINNPATQFLQQQGEQAALRTSAARGGLGGGNVLKELSRFNQGLASQDLQNQFNRAGALTGQGLQAAGQIGQLRGQQAGLSSNLIGNLGQAGAGLAGQAGGQLGGIAANLGQAGAGFAGQAGSQLGQLGLQGALFAGQAALGTGQDLAQGRTQAGQAIAGGIQGTTSSLADLINQQGGGISDLTGQAGSNLANLLSGAGQAQGVSQQQLAALLASLSVGEGSTVAGLPGIPGTQQNQGILGGLGQLAGGIGAAATGFGFGAPLPSAATTPLQAATINTGSRFGGFA
jgi:hypothetical protein